VVLKKDYGMREQTGWSNLPITRTVGFKLSEGQLPKRKGSYPHDELLYGTPQVKGSPLQGGREIAKGFFAKALFEWARSLVHLSRGSKVELKSQDEAKRKEKGRRIRTGEGAYGATARKSTAALCGMRLQTGGAMLLEVGGNPDDRLREWSLKSPRILLRRYSLTSALARVEGNSRAFQTSCPSGFGGGFFCSASRKGATGRNENSQRDLEGETLSAKTRIKWL